jgi:hypothetical protein
VSALARKKSLAKAPFAELSGDGVQVVGGPARQQFGHLEGRAQLRFADGNDGTPDRALVRWVVNAASGSELTIDVISDRTGRISTAIVLA